MLVISGQRCQRQQAILRFFYINIAPTRQQRNNRVGQIIFFKIFKNCTSRCNQNIRKRVAPDITHLMCSLVLLLTISLKLVARYSRRKCLSSFCLPVFTAFLRTTFAILASSSLHCILTHWICSNTETMSQKFREIKRIRREQVRRF